MNPWICASFICLAGAIGGLTNALMNNNGFALPRRIKGVWCPGALATVITGAFAAFASWAFYGSGAAIDLADPKALTSLRFSALAGAFLVGVVGAKWITSEADTRLLKESVRIAATKVVPKDKADEIVSGPALQVLNNVSKA